MDGELGSGAAWMFGLRGSFTLCDGDGFWEVRRGKVDVYAMPLRSGPLRFLMSLSGGQAMLGICGTEERGFRLAARPRRGAEVARHTLADLLSSASQREREVRVRWIEGWVATLSAALPGRSAGRYELVSAKSGANDLRLKDQPRRILPESGVAWIRVRSGPSCKLVGMGSEDGELDPAVWFPVTRDSSVQAQPHSVIAVRGTEALLGTEALAAGLRGFHAQVACRIGEHLETVQHSERQALDLKLKADERALGAAVSVLASPLDSIPADSVYDRSRPLLRACELVGGAEGISVRPHPSLQRPGQVKDPVSRIARASGARIRRVALSGAWWKRTRSALVGFRESDGAPVALLPDRKGGFKCVDPVSDTSSRVTKQSASSLRSFAYMMYRPFPTVPLGVGAMLKFGLNGCKAELLAMAFVGIAIAMISVAVPLATTVIFDRLIPGAFRNEMVSVSAFLIVAALCTGLFGLVRGFTILRLQSRVDSTLQAALWDRLLSLPVSFFSRFSAGDLAMRSLALSDIRRAFSGHFVSICITLISSVFSLGVIFYINFYLGAIIALMMLAGLSIATTEAIYQVKHQRKLYNVSGKISGIVLGLLNGIAKIRIAGAEKRAFRLWADVYIQQVHHSVVVRRSQNRLELFAMTYPIVSLATVFLVNSTLLSDHRNPLSTGEFLGSLAAYTQIVSAVVSFSIILSSVLGTIPQFDRMAPILREAPEAQVAKMDPGVLTGKIDFDLVTFRYVQGRAAVLRDVSVHIMPGEFIAIVGPSGSGKSTILRLLLGFEQPEEGGIYLDGRDLSSLDAREVRKQIGVVLQSDMLVTGSILSNIIGASGELSLADAWEVARLSGLDQDLQNMPMGMHTMINAGGGGLSGGQRQRVMIARALVGQPRIVVFDEATSALDNRNQAAVSENLQRFKATRVVVAHRLSTIREADRIYVLDAGRVVQCGDYATLMREGGLFASLVERQLA